MVQIHLFHRKLESDNNNTTDINAVSTRKSKKRRKEEKLDDECESDDSIRTSDMSTDEDAEGDDHDGDDNEKVTIIEDDKTDLVTVKIEPDSENKDSDITAQKTDSGKIEPNDIKNVDKVTENKTSVKEGKVNVKKATYVPVSRTEDIQVRDLRLGDTDRNMHDPCYAKFGLTLYQKTRLDWSKLKFVYGRVENIGKWRKCWLPAFSSFLTMFLKAILIRDH